LLLLLTGREPPVPERGDFNSFLSSSFSLFANKASLKFLFTSTQATAGTSCFSSSLLSAGKSLYTGVLLERRSFCRDLAFLARISLTMAVLRAGSFWGGRACLRSNCLTPTVEKFSFMSRLRASSTLEATILATLEALTGGGLEMPTLLIPEGCIQSNRRRTGRPSTRTQLFTSIK